MVFVTEWMSKKRLLFHSWCEILVFLFRKARWGPKQAGVTVSYTSCATSETLLSVRLWIPENFSCSESNDCFWKSPLICLPESGKVSFTSTLKVPACLSWVMITHSLLKLYLIAAQRHYLIFKSTYLIFFCHALLITLYSSWKINSNHHAHSVILASRNTSCICNTLTMS